MSVLVDEVETIFIDSQDAGSVYNAVAATLDVEERGTEHRECTHQSWRDTHTHTAVHAHTHTHTHTHTVTGELRDADLAEMSS